MYTAKTCIEICERMLLNQEGQENDYCDHNFFADILKRVPDSFNNDVRIFKSKKQFDTRNFYRKAYIKETKQFIVEDHCDENDTRFFDTFEKFYNYLYGNLKDADLRDYDFEGIDLSKYDYDDAMIGTEVLIDQGLYDESFYNSITYDDRYDAEIMPSEKNELIEAAAVLHDSDIIPISDLSDDRIKIHYISDIHLDCKLLKSFPKYATEQEITRYMEQFIRKIVGEYCESPRLLLIAGDTSSNFKASSIFYNVLSKVWRNRIVVTLGNHELWGHGMNDLPSDHKKRVETIISRYRNMLELRDIDLLQNDLMLSNGEIISEKRLNSIESNELRNICSNSPYIILGGIGFSGLNTEFNALNGIYQENLSLIEEFEQTERFEKIYRKVKDAISDREVIVLTHMPKEDWSKEDYNPNWIYLNGHTHLNEYYCNDEKTVYADNQIGYKSASAGLKHFYVSGQYDIFRDYHNGIYVISREEYLDFNRGKKIKLTFNRENGKIIMLKNEGMYCFFFENGDSKKIYLLNGGIINKVDIMDINYYFEKMPCYSKKIQEIFSGYHRVLKSISENVKKIGGNGTIHGSIVDIDYFNHLYVNPTDGTVTPYYATSISDKYAYPNLGNLLESQRGDLYKKYVELLDGGTINPSLLKGKFKTDIANMPIYVPETQIYKLSRIIKSVQYMNDNNVIRIWKNQIINLQSSDEKGLDLTPLGTSTMLDETKTCKNSKTT